LKKKWLSIGAGFFLFVFFLFLPLKGIGRDAKIVLSTAVLMATWWITEAIPIPATSLLPLVLFPLLGVLSSKEASLPYGDPNIFLFLGGFFIAKAMEKHNLHKRIALSITYTLGLKPFLLILGFMLATAFLSMWVSNTATTMMMLPIAMAVISQVKGNREEFGFSLVLGIAYAASIGGIGTLIGTPPNIVFAGMARNLFPRSPEITFTSWLIIGLPVTLIFLPIAWIYLSRIAKGKIDVKLSAKEIVRKEIDSMGPMTSSEKMVLAVFVATSFLWIFRKTIVIGTIEVPGWSNLLGIEKYVHDSTVAIIGALSLFIIPGEKKKPLLDWGTAVRIPWGIVLLFGGGFSLAKAFESSGLSRWIGLNLKGIGNLPPLLIVAVVCFIMTFLTELTSNTAITTLMLPILASMAQAVRIHPFLIMIPATISASCAFMLPVATPPNAIVFGSGYIKIKEMAKVGIVMNLLGILIVTLATYFLGRYFLGIVPTSFPDWAAP